MPALHLRTAVFGALPSSPYPCEGRSASATLRLQLARNWSLEPQPFARYPRASAPSRWGASLAQHGPLMRVGEDDPKSSEEVGKAEIFN